MVLTLKKSNLWEANLRTLTSICFLRSSPVVSEKGSGLSAAASWSLKNQSLGSPGGRVRVKSCTRSRRRAAAATVVVERTFEIPKAVIRCGCDLARRGLGGAQTRLLAVKKPEARLVDEPEVGEERDLLDA